MSLVLLLIIVGNNVPGMRSQCRRVHRSRLAGKVGGAPFSPAGDWQLEMAARISEFDELRTRFEVPVR